MDSSCHLGNVLSGPKSPAGTAKVQNSHGGVHWDGFSELLPEDLAGLVANKFQPTEVPYEDNPIRKLISHLLTKRPEGGFWSYEELKDIGTALLGFTPFGDSRELKSKLFRIAGKLRDREGIIIRSGQRNAVARGIRIEPLKEDDT